MNYAVANTSVTGAAGVNAAALKSLLAKIRAMGYDKLETEPANA